MEFHRIDAFFHQERQRGTSVDQVEIDACKFIASCHFTYKHGERVLVELVTGSAISKQEFIRFVHTCLVNNNLIFKGSSLLYKRLMGHIGRHHLETLKAPLSYESDPPFEVMTCERAILSMMCPTDLVEAKALFGSSCWEIVKALGDYWHSIQELCNDHELNPPECFVLDNIVACIDEIELNGADFDQGKALANCLSCVGDGAGYWIKECKFFSRVCVQSAATLNIVWKGFCRGFPVCTPFWKRLMAPFLYGIGHYELGEHEWKFTMVWDQCLLEHADDSRKVSEFVKARAALITQASGMPSSLGNLISSMACWEVFVK